MSILTLHYLPSVSWFMSVAHQKRVTIEQHDRWQKASFRNRTRIASANGLLQLTVPVVGGRSQKNPYKSIEISYDENWQHIHWQSIISSYSSSPFFEFYAPYFEPLYTSKTINLFDFNMSLLKLIVRFFKLDLAIDFTDSFEKGYTDRLDLRDHISFNQNLHAIPQYNQVFEERNGFLANISAIDLLFNEGPQAGSYLEKHL